MPDYNLPGLTNVNVELTSRCNKDCWMCGRRRIDRDYPELAMNYGDMDFALVESIATQLPDRIMVQLHNNGEALLYPRFGDAVRAFSRQTTNIVTNGKLLLEKAEEIIGLLDTLAISVIENDAEGEEQFRIIEEFLQRKGERKPHVILRLNGAVDAGPYEKFKLTIARRTIHSALGSFNYRRTPTVPEVGICLDFLNHLAINKDGLVSICVRFDPQGLGVLGDLKGSSLEELWNGPTRLQWFELHKAGKREQVPLCAYCHFWGVPTGGEAPPNGPQVDESTLFRKQD